MVVFGVTPPLMIPAMGLEITSHTRLSDVLVFLRCDTTPPCETLPQLRPGRELERKSIEIWLFALKIQQDLQANGIFQGLLL